MGWQVVTPALYSSHIETNRPMLNASTATKLDLLIADARGEIRYTVLRPSRRGVKALSGQRLWANAAPKGAFQHGSVPGADAVRSGSKCSKAM